MLKWITVQNVGTHTLWQRRVVMFAKAQMGAVSHPANITWFGCSTSRENTVRLK
jgi:hypothetical protein